MANHCLNDGAIPFDRLMTPGITFLEVILQKEEVSVGKGKYPGALCRLSNGCCNASSVVQQHLYVGTEESPYKCLF